MSEMIASLQNQTKCPHSVVILGFDEVLLMDVAGPAQVFASTNKVLGWKAYDITIASKDGGDVTTDTGLSLCAEVSFATVSSADILVVPGGPGVDQCLDDPSLHHFLIGVEPDVERFVSICSGSLLTASAGLLESRKSTTHWERADLAHQLFPSVDWHLDEYSHMTASSIVRRA
ncbi:DJ-1/PfpI family protein [Epibacterium ulvae]|uniref:DJ-1/PfpI family protein n=1 Tax=Epibacterium ulvae TaxID=1156985 RepID=UPI001BFCA989|nr:DJ-1/PfpI family protein [Epibacterium ulvae]MBT8155999.1 DJ-1/PfpI family protein [Epibacterium ulvae]